MLAAALTPEDIPNLRYPVFVSPKLDGIRLRIDPALGGVSRTHKPIPNIHIQQMIRDSIHWMKYLDGEVIIGDPTAPDVFNRTQSAVMTRSGTPLFHYYIFDYWQYEDISFLSRHDFVKDIYYANQQLFENNSTTGFAKRDIHLVPQDVAENDAEVLALEEKYLNLGYEGIIIRYIAGVYKNGRSTKKEGHLLKFKRVQDAEGTIVGFEPLERNRNALERDAFGLAKRSSHKAGKSPDDLLGNLIVDAEPWGQFSIGSGFDVDTREDIWRNQDHYLGKTVTFKYQAVGVLNKPRFPIFKGFRHD